MAEMTPMERVLTVLSGKTPDRVPLFLLFSMYGAKECNMSIQEYFQNPGLVAETQLKLQKKYQTDCLYTFTYAGIETEAFGGGTIFYPAGPPNAGDPVIREFTDIDTLSPQEVHTSPALLRTLEITKNLHTAAAGTIPIIGVVMSPFSLPVMQMGFAPYLDLMHTDRQRFDALMQCNKAFTTAWANAQLEAGATAICYFNPLASTEMIEKNLYLQTGYPVDCEVISHIQGPTATHLASGRTGSIVQELEKSGTYIVGISARDSIAELKTQTSLTLLGNLSGIRMSRWTKEETEQQVRTALAQGMPGSKFLLADNHGEIPWQVSEETLLTIASSVKKWGTY